MINIKFTPLSVVVLTISIAASALAQAVETIDSIAAVVDDDVVLNSELTERINQISQNFTENGQPLPPESELRKNVLDQLILESLQLQRGIRAGLRVSDEQLNAALSQIATRQGGTLEQFRNSLLQQGRYYSAVDQIRKEIIIQQVQSGSLNRLVNVTPEEIDAFLLSPEGRDLSETRYLLAHVIAPTADSSTSSLNRARTHIETARAQLKSGSDPREVTTNYNRAQPGSLEGGVMGWRTADELPSLFANVAPTLTIGDVSEVIEAGNGLHVVKLLDVSTKAQLVKQRKGRHILIKPSAILTNDEAFEKAYALRVQALEGTDFSELARENSEDIGSAAEGGDIGWSRPGVFVPEFEQALMETAIGDISEPVRTQFGWHIILAEEEREVDMLQDMIKNRAFGLLRERKFGDARDEWLQQLRNNAYVDIK